MRLIFRIMDSDINRAKLTTLEVLRLIRRYRFDAEAYQVTEMLEHGRQGVADALPALEINNIIVSKGAPLTPDKLEPIFDRLRELSRRR
jgi:hypothetical protein